MRRGIELRYRLAHQDRADRKVHDFLDVSLTRQPNSNVPHDQTSKHREKASRHSQ
jgi:hypothetical protein